MDNVKVLIGKEFRESRKNACLTVEEVARLLDISTGKVSNIENAKSDCFQVDLIKKIHKTLDLDIYGLVMSSLCSSQYKNYDDFFEKLRVFFNNHPENINIMVIGLLSNFLQDFNDIIDLVDTNLK